MARASAPGAPEGSEPSAFELLVDASVEVPSWIQVSRRGGLNRDPAAGLFILVAAVWSFSLVSAAFSFVFFNPLLAALLGSLGITLSDRKSTRLNSSHSQISYALFSLKKKALGLALRLPPADDPLARGQPSYGCERQIARLTTSLLVRGDRVRCRLLRTRPPILPPARP